MSQLFKAPSALGTGATVYLHDGTTTHVDAAGFISVGAGYVSELTTAGFTPADSNDVTVPKALYTAMTDTGAAVITGAALQANLAVIEMTGIQASAGHTLTLPTMTVLAAAFTDFQAGHSFIMRIINGGTGAYAWTLTAPGDASLVLTGAAMTINQYAFRDFIVTLTSATAGTVKAIGTSLNSGV